MAGRTGGIGWVWAVAALVVACADEPAGLAPEGASPGDSGGAPVAAAPAAPAAGVVGYRFATPCRALPDPGDGVVVVDLEFLDAAGPGTPLDERALTALLDAGADVLHRFDAPVARVRVTFRALDALLTAERAVAARIVPDAARHDLVLALDTDGAPLSAADEDLLQSLGTRVVDPRPLPDVLIAANDATVPALSAHFGARLRLEPLGCDTGN